jgi:hypothetical protein
LKYELVIAGSPGWLSKKILAEIAKSKNKENIHLTSWICLVTQKTQLQLKIYISTDWQIQNQ